MTVQTLCYHGIFTLRLAIIIHIAIIWPMKRLAMLLALFALPALAAEEAKPIPLHQTPSNVQIVNGKKFFSLSNARRFNGSLNSPKALSVMHHPHTPGLGTATARGMLPIAPPGGHAAPAAQTPQNNSDKVLSIFAPDDKHTPVPPVPGR